MLTDAVHMQSAFLICCRDWTTPFFGEKRGGVGEEKSCYLIRFHVLCAFPHILNMKNTSKFPFGPERRKKESPAGIHETLLNK